MADSRSSREVSNHLVVVILGCTGTGKSKLAIEIAKEIQGEIISADSMQVYKGLDLITNKVTAAEQASVPHHMINIAEANDNFSVLRFKAMALPIIDDIVKRNKFPIIVGGTNYYIESLLWENLIEEARSNTDNVDTKSHEKNTTHGAGSEILDDEKESDFVRQYVGDLAPNLSQQSQDLPYGKLVKVDPSMAERHHPNDTRKIKRSLQVLERSGTTHSELIARQKAHHGATEYGGPMRFQNVCILWLQCKLKTLDERLDTRVDNMIEQGVVEELLDFHNSWKSATDAGGKMHNTEGIFQAIGFKEFRDFLNSENPREKVHGELFRNCVDSMKCATRRYARKQIKWVTNRFLGRAASCVPDIYGLDATDLGQWESCVLQKALNIIRHARFGGEIVEQPLTRIHANAASKHTRHICKLCNERMIIGEKNWSIHLRSRSHRHYKKKAKKSESDT